MVVDNEELSVVQSMLTLLTVIDIAWPSRAKLVPSIAQPRKNQGGISNIFLCKLAQNIQDKYGEAAIFAEQAILYIRTLHSSTNKTMGKIFL